MPNVEEVVLLLKVDKEMEKAVSYYIFLSCTTTLLTPNDSDFIAEIVAGLPGQYGGTRGSELCSHESGSR